MNEDNEWKITSSWTINVDWKGYWNNSSQTFIIVSDENLLIDNIEEQFQKSEDKTSIAEEMLTSIGVKI